MNRQFQTAPPKKSQRIDPSQMPRPELPSSGLIFHTNSGTTTGSGRKIPPGVNCDFKVIDTGNCSPRYIRCTSTAVPASHEVQSMTGIPICLISTPLATPRIDELNPPLINLGEAPPRCTRCKGYVNIQSIWTNQGNSWICNLCGLTNQTPTWYISSLDSAGLRHDRLSRPELCYGAIDYLVGPDFSVRPLQEQIYGFCIDISIEAIDSGFTSIAISILSQILQILFERATTNQTEIKVGIATFNSDIQLYRIHAISDDPIKVIICSSEDPFAYMPYSEFCLPITKSLSDLQLLLEKLPLLVPSLQSKSTRFPDTTINRNHLVCPVATVSCLQQIMQVSGGQVYIITSRSSNIGYGAIYPREYESLYGTDDEWLLYTTINNLTKF